MKVKITCIVYVPLSRGERQKIVGIPRLDTFGNIVVETPEGKEVGRVPYNKNVFVTDVNGNVLDEVLWKYNGNPLIPAEDYEKIKRS